MSNIRRQRRVRLKLQNDPKYSSPQRRRAKVFQQSRRKGKKP